MNRQRLFNNAVRRLHGKGRSLEEGQSNTCAYFKKGHPGCAIGCQPGFRKFKGHIDAGGDISILLTETPAVAVFFGVKNVDDKAFLMRLQRLHDDSTNWRGMSLTKKAINAFAKQFELTVPSLEKKT